MMRAPFGRSAALIGLCLACFGTGAPTAASAADYAEIIRVGVAEEAVSAYERPYVEATVKQLKAALRPEFSLEVRRFTAGELIPAIRRNQVDLFLASSATYRQSLLNGTRDLAVLSPEGAANPSRTDGAVILADIEREDIRGLSSLKGRTVATAGEFSNTTLVSIENEVLVRTGGNPKDFFGSRLEYGTDWRRAVQALVSGRADVLLMPVCSLEFFAGHTGADTSRLTVLHPKQDRGLPCLHSTALFPGLTVTAMPSLSHEAAGRILRTLVTIPDESHRLRWALAADFSLLDTALHDLNDDAWAPLRKPSWKKLLLDYWPWAAGLVGLVLFVMMHSVVVGILVRRRTAELSQALSEQKRLRLEAGRIRDRLDKMKRLQTIGQLAGLFAHELRQPLNAISCYAYGLRRALGASAQNEKSVSTGIDGMDREIRRASAIVERVRDYVRSQSSRNTVHHLSSIVRTAADNFATTSLGSCPVTVTCRREEETLMRCDPMEMELIVVNLMRNAAQAQNGSDRPEIRMSVEGRADCVVFSIEDNGPPLSDSALSDIISVGESTKPEGLGLGLSIVRDLTEAHHGEIRFGRSSWGSLSVTIIFPSAAQKEVLS